MYVSVDYIVATGGSGTTRMPLEELPTWLAGRPGTLIHAVMAADDLKEYDRLRWINKETMKRQLSNLT